MKTAYGLLLAVILMTIVNCSSARKTAAENGNIAVSITNAQTETPSSIAASESVAAQANTAPDALVKDLYKQHDADKSPFFQTKSRALVDKYFDKNLADLIWNEAKEPKDGIGALEADPLYSAQDTDIKNFAVGEPKITGDKAEVIVTFNNYAQKEKFVYSLIKQNGSWKISDINYGDYTLVKLYKDYAKSSPENNGSNLNEFEGRYQVGDTTCTVKPVKMAFEVRWEKGAGVEMFFSEGSADDRYIFASDPETGKANSFAFTDENYNTGTFYRADGKEFPVRRIK